MSVRVAVLASGGGSNLQAMLDAFNTVADAPARIALVISDRDSAGALERARALDVPAFVVPVSGRPEAEVAADTLELLERHAIGLVALAGYLRLVPAAVIRAYAGRMVNIHPALLPAFGGKGMYGSRVHRAVLASGARVTGPSVHYVTENYDEGRIIAQWPVPVLTDDTAETLAARVLLVEHRLYPLVIAALALGRTEREAEPRAASFHWLEHAAPDAAEMIHLIQPSPLD
ncbi:MAG: phosphoribosylglycinamide formyltransferase [Gemmatimonadetes bacterium]|nr:phosphoribosylglycinamide formyltransferase [Gemmatimonadota bacterium]